MNNKHLIEQLESNLSGLEEMLEVQTMQLATLECALEDLSFIDLNALSGTGKIRLEFRIQAVERKVDDGKERLASIMSLLELSRQAIELLNLEDTMAENPSGFTAGDKSNCHNSLAGVLKNVMNIQYKLNK